MRNIARKSVLLFLVALLVGFAYFLPKVEAVTVSAKDSQESIQKLNNKINLEQQNIKQVNNEAFLKTENNLYDSTVEENTEAEVESSEGKARTFRATAYCLRGRTASGRMVRRGIVAADPRVLPLGTKIRLSGGRYSGNYIVADTGGKIKGRVLDIWVPSCAEARNWGNRTVKVTVIGKAKKKRKRRR